MTAVRPRFYATVGTDLYDLSELSRGLRSVYAVAVEALESSSLGEALRPSKSFHVEHDRQWQAPAWEEHDSGVKAVL